MKRESERGGRCFYQIQMKSHSKAKFSFLALFSSKPDGNSKQPIIVCSVGAKRRSSGVCWESQ